MTLGDYQKAQQQYTEGLLIEPKNTHLLTALQPIDQKNSLVQLDSAINYMTKSYQLDAKDQNTTFKLSICYYQVKDCKNALKFYEECKALGGQPITEDFTKALKELCNQTK